MFRGVILENTFTSMSEMVDKVMFVAKYFKSLILANHWRSVDIVNLVQRPMLFVTGNNDELVPSDMTVELHEKAKGTKHKEIFIVFGGTHNDTWYVGGKQYTDKIKAFIKHSLMVNQNPEEI